MSSINYIVSGYLGDFFHTMYVPHVQYLKTGKKGIIYITDDPKYEGDKFTMGVERTYKDTYPLIIQQEYVADYRILDQTSESELNQDTTQPYINLNIWRRSTMQCEWNMLMAIIYKLELVSVPLFHFESNPQYKDNIVIHRSKKAQRHVGGFPYELILRSNNNCVFITCDESEYDAFILTYRNGTNGIKLKLCADLMELARIISSCRIFVGNQSAPLALAYCLKKPCLAELIYPHCYINNAHYTEFNWFHSVHFHNYSNVQKYLSLEPPVHTSISPDKSEKAKIKSAYYLSHNGLNDTISNVGAIRYLLNYYETIYFICAQNYEKEIQRMLGPNVILKTIPFDAERSLCNTIIGNISDNSDIFITGCCHTPFLKSKISHPDLLNRVRNDKNYDTDYPHVKMFYYDINLDLSIYYEYFDIDSSNVSLDLYKQLADYKIVFCDVSQIDNDNVMTYRSDENYIIICPNKNVYNKDEKQHPLVEKCLNQLIGDYIDIIKNADVIRIGNLGFSESSVFRDIIMIMKMSGRLKTKDVHL